MRTGWKILGGRGIASILMICFASISCGSSESTHESVRTQEVASKIECVLKPIDNEGTLPTCAAGTPTASGPGKPVGNTGTGAAVLSLSDADKAAIQKANELAAARRREAGL